MQIRMLLPQAVMLAGCLAGHAPPAWAHEPEPAGASTPATALPDADAAHRNYFTDLPLLTQSGREVRFYSDLLKDRVVLIHFLFTHCKSACPILARTVRELQSLLGDRVGREVRLLSISVDPERDTPGVLKRYAESLGAGEGWTFLTGKKENVDWVIHKLGQYHPDFEAHSPLFLLGNVPKGHWMKIRGDASPELLQAQIEALLAES